jgi:hypothetical protein
MDQFELFLIRSTYSSHTGVVLRELMLSMQLRQNITQKSIAWNKECSAILRNFHSRFKKRKKERSKNIHVKKNAYPRWHRKGGKSIFGLHMTRRAQATLSGKKVAGAKMKRRVGLSFQAPRCG